MTDTLAHHPQQLGLPGEDGEALLWEDAIVSADERLNLPGLLAHQRPPKGMWKGWLLMSGRGAGKTFAGAKYLHRAAMDNPGLRCRLLAPTYNDAVASCIEGESGILNLAAGEVQWLPTHAGGSILKWRNGSVCYVLGLWAPRDLDRLRAITNVSLDWFEEAAAIPVLDEAVKLAKFSRRGKNARWIATTTPRPRPTIREWNEDEDIVKTKATSHDNPHTPEEWRQSLEDDFGGTRLGQQEIEGELVEDVDGSLWKFEWLARSRVPLEHLEDLEFDEVAVGVDPANSTGTTGIVIVGRTSDDHLWVIADLSLTGASSDTWARAAVQGAIAYGGCLVAEHDSGGDAIRGVLKAADLNDQVKVKPAWARKLGGKKARAEPIATLWEKATPTAHLVGEHSKLEDELTTWVPGESHDSPDRLDALVWACTYLTRGGDWSSVETHAPTHRARTDGRPRGKVAYRSARARRSHAT